MINRNLLCGVTMCTLLTIGRIAGAQGPASVPAPPVPGTPANAQASGNAQASANAQASGNQVTVPFSDPSRPGTVKVSVLSGSISVSVGPGRDVTVTTTS